MWIKEGEDWRIKMVSVYRVPHMWTLLCSVAKQDRHLVNNWSDSWKEPDSICPIMRLLDASELKHSRHSSDLFWHISKAGIGSQEVTSRTC